MADLKFEVDSSEVSRAVDELIRMGKASKDTAKAFEQGFRKVVSWQERFQAEQGRINATLEKNYRAQTLSNKSARESASVFQQLDAEVSKAAASYSQLKAAIDPVYAAQMRMKKGHDAIRAALKAGVITRAEAAQSLRAYRAEMKALSQTQMAATKASNRFGVVTQQAGYQIGDFLVQVQSGTSPFVAFGQQATQLVGILPLMTGAFGLSTTALIGLSAGLGIVIPLVTAIGAAFMRSGEQAKEASDDISEFEDRIKSLDSSLKDYLRTQSAAKLGISVEESLSIEAQEKALADYTSTYNALVRSIKQELAVESVGVSRTLEQEEEILQNRLDASDEVQAALAKVEEAENRLATLRKKESDEALEGVEEYTREMVSFFREAYLKVRQMDEDSVQAREEAVQSGIRVFREAQKRMREEAEESARKQAEAESASESRLSRIALIMSQIRRETEDTATAAGSFARNLQAAIDADKIGFTRGGQALNKYGGRGTTDPRDPTLNGESIYGDDTGTSSLPTEDNGLESFIEGLMTERETLEQWRSEQLELLGQYNETELEIIGGQAEAKLRLEQEYSDRLVKIKKRESDMVSGSAKAMYGDLAGLLNMFAGKSKAAAIASIALTKGLRIAEIIASGAAAQVRALAELGPILGPPAAAKIAGFTKVQAGIVAATGLMQAGGALSSGGGGGLGSSQDGAAATMPAQSQPATPQKVIIEGIDRSSLISGEQLSNIFEALYEENENRGFVFEVAR